METSQRLFLMIAFRKWLVCINYLNSNHCKGFACKMLFRVVTFCHVCLVIFWESCLSEEDTPEYFHYQSFLLPRVTFLRL